MEDLQTWLEVAVIPRLNVDENREMLQTFDDAMTNEDMETAVQSAKSLMDAAGIDLEEAEILAEELS